MQDKLFTLIKRKPFRKWALPAGAEERIRRAVQMCTAENRSLNFVFEFGGYKLWRLPSAPFADAAETYMLKYYIEYLRPVAELYAPGVNLFFASDDCVVERMNNIKAEAMEQYAVSFRQCIEETKALRPKNMNFSYIRLAELYPDRSMLEEELKITFADNRKKFDFWSEEKKTRMLGRAELNFCVSGPLAAYDLSGISPEEYQKRLIDGAVYHDAFEDCSKRCEFVLADDRILLFCTPIPEAVPVGTTKASVTKFWTGVGVLENGLEKVLSPSQWQEKLKCAG